MESINVKITMNNKQFYDYCVQKHKLSYFYYHENTALTHIDGVCSNCERDVNFVIINDFLGVPVNNASIVLKFLIYRLRCPRCGYYAYELYASFTGNELNGGPSTQIFQISNIYNVTELKDEEIVHDIPEELQILIKNFEEAQRCKNAGFNIAASIMYRKTLDVLCSDLGAPKHFMLGKKLEWLKENDNNLNISLTQLFLEFSDIVSKIGNQAAHTKGDESLSEFSEDDSKDMSKLVIHLLTEVFTKPKLERQLVEEMKKRRKLI